jgi:hypothetical protein
MTVTAVNNHWPPPHRNCPSWDLARMPPLQTESLVTRDLSQLSSLSPQAQSGWHCRAHGWRPGPDGRGPPAGRARPAETHIVRVLQDSPSFKLNHGPSHGPTRSHHHRLAVCCAVEGLALIGREHLGGSVAFVYKRSEWEGRGGCFSRRAVSWAA